MPSCRWIIKLGQEYFSRQAGGHDAHHPLVPPLAGEDQGAALAPAAGSRSGPTAWAKISCSTACRSRLSVAQLPGQLLRPGRGRR